MEHLSCAWHEFQGRVRRVVVESVEHLPLAEICARLRGASLAICRSPSIVRYELIQDRSLIADLVQDVAVAMTGAVVRGRIHAARPAIYGWIDATAPRIVSERCRPAAVLALTGALFAERPANDDGSDGWGQSSYRVEAQIAHGDRPDQVAECEQYLATVIPGRLTTKQQAVVRCWLAGDEPADIAAELGITSGAVRLRLMQARRRLAD